MSKKSLDAPFIPARNNDLGVVKKKNHDDGIVRSYRLIDQGEENFDDIMDDAYNRIMRDEELVNKTSKYVKQYQKPVYNEETKKPIFKQVNSQLSKIIVRTVENPQVQDKLPDKWYKDLDYIRTIGKLIVKKYDVNLSEVIQTIKQIYT